MNRDEVNQDPVQGEFFAPEEGYPSALIRETIQNSLDAKDPDSTHVEVHFSFVEETASQTPFGASPFFSGLYNHLVAQQISDRPEGYANVPFLLIEDYGTRGLQGSTEQSNLESTESDEPKNHFFYFWRNIGRSVKSATERGRWGLGKTVFPAASHIHSFFGYTVRSSEPAPLLMGQSVGKIHMVGSSKHAAYGYFARFADDGFAQPFTDDETIIEFAREFSLGRQGQPGLSVVVPFPDSSLTPASLARAVLRSFYLPILFGDLVVHIDGNASEKWRISRESIDAVVSEVEWDKDGDSDSREDLKHLMAFAKAVVAVTDEDTICLKMPSGAGAPSWSATRVEQMFEERNLARIRERFEGGELLALRIPVNVVKSGNWQEQSYFRVFMRRDAGLVTGQGDFVRQGLTISHVNRPPKPGTRGLVLVNDSPLSSLLGDSENPAHTKWQEKAESLSSKYLHGTSIVRFVNRSLIELSSILSRPPEGREEDLLIDLFYVDIPPDAEVPLRPTPGNLPSSEDEPGDPPPTIVGEPEGYRLHRLQNGFRIRAEHDGLAPLERIDVRVAYAVRRGNPFKRYQELDFRLDQSPINVSPKNAEVSLERNLLSIRPTGENFSVDVKGFDPNRDLEIDTVGRRSEP